MKRPEPEATITLRRLDALRGGVSGQPDAVASASASAASADSAAAIAAELCDVLRTGLSGPGQQTLSRAEFELALGAISAIARAIDVRALDRAARDAKLVTALRHWLLALKLDDAGVVYEPTDDGDLRVVLGGVPVATLSDLTAHIELTTYDSGSLNIDARVGSTALFRDVPLRFVATVGGAEQPALVTGEYAAFRLFGHTLFDGVHLRVSCPDLPSSAPGEIALKAYAQRPDGDRSGRMQLTYGTYSHLASRWRYWRTDGLKFVGRGDRIEFARQSVARFVADEAALIVLLLASFKRHNASVAFTRLAYWATRFHFKRANVWLTHDKMYSAGDCAEYMYWHLESRRAGFTPYYAINADAPEVPRLRAQGCRLVFPGTLLHRLVYLNASVIITSHADPAVYNRMTGQSASLRDLYSARIVCVQHGLTVMDFARNMHHSAAGVERYYCASRYEITNLLDPAYGYSADQLALTGIPRFDGLKSDPKRRILIAPTWRAEFAGVVTPLGERRSASARFLDTPFFRIYSGVLLDERVLACAEETGYRLDFVLHPYLVANAAAVSAHLRDSLTAAGHDPGRIHVVLPSVEEPYETVLEEADLLVTDFSGIQYDFAYMNKPVVYFQPPELPAQYVRGAMDYETIGFGEVTSTADDVADLLCTYMRRDCAIAETYRSRIQSFFVFHDAHNCERILVDLLGHLDGQTAR